MVAVQCCLDIASHVIADQGWVQAPTMAASFERLADNAVISRDVAGSLGRAVGFRNVVAHGYVAMNIDALWQAAGPGLGDLESFAGQIAHWMKSS